MKHLFYTALFPLFLMGFQEKKLNKPKYFIHCKIDGKDYLSAICKNCIIGQLIGDTALLLNSNVGKQTLRIGISDGVKVTAKSYLLNDLIDRQGVYDNSPLAADVFKTDEIFTGELKITSLDKDHKIVSGIFYFQAYNPVQKKIVSVSDGKFRLKYKT